jgi:hypothetical protein
MDNFDLKKYLVENKVTTNSKLISEKLTSDKIADLLDSIPEHTETYFEENGLRDYMEPEVSSDEPMLAIDILEELGKEDIPIYKKIPSGQKAGVQNYLYYDLEDGYVLGTEDYEFAYPKIYNKRDLNNLLAKHPELQGLPPEEPTSEKERQRQEKNAKLSNDIDQTIINRASNKPGRAPDAG